MVTNDLQPCLRIKSPPKAAARGTIGRRGQREGNGAWQVSPGLALYRQCKALRRGLATWKGDKTV